MTKDNGRSFYQNTLKGKFVADDANTYDVAAAAGGIFAGLQAFRSTTARNFTMSIRPTLSLRRPVPRRRSTMRTTAGVAGIQVAGSGGRGSVVMFGFPFETITTSGNRAEVIKRVFDFFHGELNSFAVGTVIG